MQPTLVISQFNRLLVEPNIKPKNVIILYLGYTRYRLARSQEFKLIFTDIEWNYRKGKKRKRRRVRLAIFGTRNTTFEKFISIQYKVYNIYTIDEQPSDKKHHKQKKAKKRKIRIKLEDGVHKDAYLYILISLLTQ